MWGRSRLAPLSKTTVPAPLAVSWGSRGTPAAPCSVRPRFTPVLGGRRGPRRGASLPGDGLGELDSRPSFPSPWLRSWPLTARVITGFRCGGGGLRWSLCECGGAPGAPRVWAPGALRYQPGALANSAPPPNRPSECPRPRGTWLSWPCAGRGGTQPGSLAVSQRPGPGCLAPCLALSRTRVLGSLLSSRPGGLRLHSLTVDGSPPSR